MKQIPYWIDENAYQALPESQKSQVPTLAEEISKEWLLWVCSSKVQQILSLWIVNDDYVEEFNQFSA